MKKLFGISLIAVLTASPLMANAATGDTAPSSNLTVASGEVKLASNAENVVFAAEPFYAGKVISTTDRAITASAAYVKGAYNDAISAVNEVALKESLVETAVTGISSSIIPTLASKSLSDINDDGKANISAKGTVDLTKSDYASGTVGKALVDIKTTADGAASKANSAVQSVKINGTALTEDANHDVNLTVTSGTAAGTIKVNGTDVAVTGVLTGTDYAKKSGVKNTISHSTASGKFDIVTDWANETVTQVTVSSTITGADYSEPAS